MKQINKKGFISMYVYLMFMGITIIISSIITGTLLANYFGVEVLNKTKSYYASETGIEEGLLAYKRQPDIDKFIPNEAIIQEEGNKRKTEYTEQKVYKKELVIKETIEAGKSIQIPFRKKDLDSRITKFHIAILQYDTKNPPLNQTDCETPLHDTSVEISAFQKATILSVDPLDYTVELNSNWNGCYIGNNAAGKTSLITYSDPYSNEKVSLVGDKCIMNSEGNVTGAVFEQDIPYVFDDKGDTDDTNNSCEYNCSGSTCSKYYTYNTDVNKKVKSSLKFYTISENFIYDDMSDSGLILFDFRAIQDDAEVAMWATDDDGNPFEIPGRFISFSSLGISQGGDLDEGLFTRLKLKKKANSDLLPIFSYSLYSESEFIK